MFLEPLESRNLLAFNPSGMEQEFLQLLNRMRVDPQGELGRLVSQTNPIASTDPQIDLNLKFWKVDGNELGRQWRSLTPAPPLAWHESLYNAALGHNQLMIANRDQQHQFPGEPNPGERMRNAGYPTRAWAENIAAYCTTVVECHASYAIDWGAGPAGLQTPPRHREIMTSTSYREVGIAVTEHTKANPSDVGPLVTTQDFSNRGNFGNPWVVGAAFDDRNDSGWYENGEGFGGGTVKFVGTAGTFTTTTMTAGGYQIQLPAGTYTATASGGGLRETLTVANVTVGADNVWLNFLQKPNQLTGDRLEPNNDFDTASQLTSGDVRVDTVSIHLPDNDDIYRWTSPATGELKVDLNFRHADGNLDLYLYNDARTQAAVSNGSSDTESISFQVTAGSTWYIGVKGAQRAVNRDYSLVVNGPGGTVPQAVDDKTATDKNISIAINILANDTDADGDMDPTSVQIAQQPQNGTLTVNAQTGVVTYAPNTDFLGVDRFTYRVRDTASLTSQNAAVVIGVVDYANHPWRNPTNPMDIDASGAVVPLDALVIINRLNQRGPGPLPAQPTGPDSPPGFFDASGDDFLSSIDALRVINFLNQQAAEGEGAQSARVRDQVFEALPFAPAQNATGGELTEERKSSSASEAPANNGLMIAVPTSRSSTGALKDDVFRELGEDDTTLEQLLPEGFPGINLE